MNFAWIFVIYFDHVIVHFKYSSTVNWKTLKYAKINFLSEFVLALCKRATIVC